MGQIEVYNWLHKAQQKENRFYTIKEISEGLKQEGYTNGCFDGTANDCAHLLNSNYLETDIIGNPFYFKRIFKLKDKYLSKAKIV